MPSIGEIQVISGDTGIEIMPDSEEFRLICCGCGLTHRVEIDRSETGNPVLYFIEEGEDG